MNSSLKLSF